MNYSLQELSVNIHEVKQGNLIFSSDKNKLDITYLHEQLSSFYWAKNIPLHRLEKSLIHSVASLKREFLALRHMLEDWTDKPTANGVESGAASLLMETVLLLRQLAKPEHVRIAQGELKRLGVLAE